MIIDVVPLDLTTLPDADLQRLLAWRNENRHAFAGAREVTWDEHVAWARTPRANEQFNWVSSDGKYVGTITVIDHGIGGVELARVVLGDKRVARRGVMTAAILRLLALHRNRPAWLHVRRDNDAAKWLYVKCGFVITGLDGASWRMEWRAPTHFDEVASSFGCDKGYGHRYGVWYEEQLASWAPASILEIGVHLGASLRLWETLYPNARIASIDIDPACAVHASDRSRIFIGSQADAGFLADVVAQFGLPDLIVDDGSHAPSDMRASLAALWPSLAPGGLYVIEDVEFDDSVAGIVEPAGVAPAVRRSIHGRSLLFLHKP